MPHGQEEELAQDFNKFDPDQPVGMKIVGYSADGRPIIENMDGSISIDSSIVVQVEPDGWMNIPTMFEGKHVTPDQAVELVKKAGYRDPDTNQPLPLYPSQAEAEAARRERASRIAEEVRRIKEGV